MAGSPWLKIGHGSTFPAAMQKTGQNHLTTLFPFVFPGFYTVFPQLYPQESAD